MRHGSGGGGPLPEGRRRQALPLPDLRSRPRARLRDDSFKFIQNPRCIAVRHLCDVGWRGNVSSRDLRRLECMPRVHMRGCVATSARSHQRLLIEVGTGQGVASRAAGTRGWPRWWHNLCARYGLLTWFPYRQPFKTTPRVGSFTWMS